MYHFLNLCCVDSKQGEIYRQQPENQDGEKTLVTTYYEAGSIFSYKLRYIVGFWLVEMAISTNQKPTIYRNLYENTGPKRILSVVPQRYNAQLDRAEFTQKAQAVHPMLGQRRRRWLSIKKHRVT